MISYYTSIVIVSTLSLFVISIGITENHNISNKTGILFIVLFSIIAALNWLEWLSVHVNRGGLQLRNIHIAAKFLEHTLTPVAPIVAIKILSHEKIPAIFTAPFFVNLFFHILSLFNGCIFSVGDDNLYTRGSLYFLYVLAFVSGIINILIYCFKFSRKYQFANIMFLSTIILLLIISIVFPFAAPQLKLDWTCASFAAIMFYVYYCQLEQQIDSVTALLNRKSYDYAISSLKKKTGMIFFDIDNFKYINDTYGHNYADDCLYILSGEMKKVFEKKGYCYRYGGDEFCVIVSKNTDEMQRLTEKYLESIKTLQLKDSHIPSISAGYAIFDPLSEAVDSALARAEEMMYHNKQAAKAEKNN